MKFVLSILIGLSSLSLQAQNASCCDTTASALEANSARCTGSSSCRACKTCNYCAYCTGGGSCGVCGGGKTYSAPNRVSSKGGSRSTNAYSNPSISIGSKASVISSTLNVRSGPGTNFDVVFTLNSGDQVEVMEKPNNGWVKVSFRFRSDAGWETDKGFVSIKYLSF